jgi:hypothetical protein
MTDTILNTDAVDQDMIDAVASRHEPAPTPVRRSFQARMKPSAAVLRPMARSVSSGIAEILQATPKTDHINALENTSTGIELELGNFLGIDTNAQFYHPDFLVSFNSIRGVWGSIKDPARLEFFRRSHGAECRNAIATIKERGFIPNFRQAIAEAMWYKVISYPEMAAKMAETTAVFTNYFYKKNSGGSNITVSTNESPWLCMILEEIRDTLKLRENEPDEEKKLAIEPDFSSLSTVNMFKNR